MSAALHLFSALRAAPPAAAVERMLTVSALLSAVAAPAESTATGRKVTHEVLLDGLLPQGDAGGGGSGGAYRGGLKVREDVGGAGFYVEGLTELAAESEDEVPLPPLSLSALLSPPFSRGGLDWGRGCVQRREPVPAPLTPLPPPAPPPRPASAHARSPRSACGGRPRGRSRELSPTRRVLLV